MNCMVNTNCPSCNGAGNCCSCNDAGTKSIFISNDVYEALRNGITEAIKELRTPDKPENVNVAIQMLKGLLDGAEDFGHIMKMIEEVAKDVSSYDCTRNDFIERLERIKERIFEKNSEITPEISPDKKNCGQMKPPETADGVPKEEEIALPTMTVYGIFRGNLVELIEELGSANEPEKIDAVIDKVKNFMVCSKNDNQLSDIANEIYSIERIADAMALHDYTRAELLNKLEILMESVDKIMSVMAEAEEKAKMVDMFRKMCFTFADFATEIVETVGKEKIAAILGSVPDGNEPS